MQIYNFLKVGNQEEKEQSLAGQKPGQAKNCLNECSVILPQLWLTEKQNVCQWLVRPLRSHFCSSCKVKSKGGVSFPAWNKMSWQLPLSATSVPKFQNQRKTLFADLDGAFSNYCCAMKNTADKCCLWFIDAITRRENTRHCMNEVHEVLLCWNRYLIALRAADAGYFSAAWCFSGQSLRPLLYVPEGLAAKLHPRRTAATRCFWGTMPGNTQLCINVETALEKSICLSARKRAQPLSSSKGQSPPRHLLSHSSSAWGLWGQPQRRCWRLKEGAGAARHFVPSPPAGPMGAARQMGNTETCEGKHQVLPRKALGNKG